MDKKVQEAKQPDTTATKSTAPGSSRKHTQAKKSTSTAREQSLNPFQQMEKQWRDSGDFLADFFQEGWLQPYQRFMPEWSAFNPSELKTPQDWFAAFWGEPRQWGFPEWPFAAQTPKMDLITRDDAYVIRAAIPGVKQGDVEVSFSGNTITLKGKTAEEKDEESGDYHVHETLTGSFARTLSLPGAIDTDKASTTLEDGMLEIVVPKAG